MVGEDSSKQIDQPHLKIRGGTIIPLGKVIQNTTQKSLDPLTLLVCLGKNGCAEGRLYEDAGDGFEYKQGEYLLTKYTAKLDGKILTISAKSRKGKLGIPKREVVVKVVMDDKVVEKKIREYDGFAAKIKLRNGY